jgi:hypothetical protein
MKVAETSEHTKGRAEIARRVDSAEIADDLKAGIHHAMQLYEEALGLLKQDRRDREASDDMQYYGGVVDGALWACGIAVPRGGIEL